MKRRMAIPDRNKKNRIWELLLSRNGNWIPARELSEISLQYRSTIAFLRRSGVLIENKVVVEGGVQRSLYRLKPTLRRTKDQLSLFSSAELDRCSHRWTDPEEQPQ
jgi:hypothetical protein